MIVKESESGEKRCCDGTEAHENCIGAMCMAWVWLDGQGNDQEFSAGFCGLVYKIDLEEI